MATSLSEFPKAIAPTEAETTVARESSRHTARILKTKRKTPLRICVQIEGESETAISIPLSAFRLLNDILAQMALGHALTLVPVDVELTTQQAADLLNVSRPFLVEQLDKGEIPHRKVGTHWRVFLPDLLAYKQRIDSKRLKALENLSSLDQELGLGY